MDVWDDAAGGAGARIGADGGGAISCPGASPAPTWSRNARIWFFKSSISRRSASISSCVERVGGAACATGIVPPDQDEMAATLADWLDEIERIQLLLRLSPRLRQRHGD